MSIRGFWNSVVAKLLLTQGDGGKFFPECSIYIRDDGTWIFPTNQLGRGGAGIMRGPAERTEPGADASTLGRAILAAMGRSHVEKWNSKSPVSTDDAPKSAGFKSFGDLERAALHLNVYADGEIYRCSPWAASNNGGYEGIAGAERTCSGEPQVLGQVVLELSKLCVARRPKSKAASAKLKRTEDFPVRDPNDLPVSFGYKMGWIAVASAEGSDLVNWLKLRKVRRCSWNDGLERAHDLKGVFVTPPMGEWTLALGWHPEAGQDDFIPYLEELSRRFGRAFLFDTHRIVEYHAWAFAEGGKIKRAFGYVGEKGKFLVNVGDPTPEEHELGVGIEDHDHPPSEEDVLNLAAKWVLDPREIDLEVEACGPGWYGVLGK